MLVDWNKSIPPEEDRESLLYSAYRYFELQIKEYDYDKIVKLYNYITLGIKVAQINLFRSENDDEDVTPEKLFASLNATGRMLSEFDYLRNYLFLRAGADSDRFYESKTHWHHSFEDDTLDLDTFLRAFLKVKLGPSCFQNEKKTI